jgi:hypothetical protein
MSTLAMKQSQGISGRNYGLLWFNQLSVHSWYKLEELLGMSGGPSPT